MEIFVTVGMGRWPFNRLLNAVAPLCGLHNLFAQTGTSDVRLPCRVAPYLTFPETLECIAAADIVITHAGNTVRLVQRQGKVPIAMAREAARGEMGNDHQVKFLRYEEQHGRVVAVWNGADLPELVRRHPENQKHLLATRCLPEGARADHLASALDRLCAKWIK